MPASGGLCGLVLQAQLLASERSAGHIATTKQCLQRLILGGIRVVVLVQAAAADDVIQQQNLLSKHCLPEGVTVVTTQPRVLAVCLRAVATQMGLDPSVVAFVAMETQEATAACRLAGLQFLTMHALNSSHHLSQLLHHVADSHRQHSTALLVGYTMKPSRERNLASRGLLPLSAPHGVCFVPVDFARPLEQQGPFDVMLHKATDELISGGPQQLPHFSPRIASLAAYTRDHPETALVDPLEKVHQVIDRQTLTECLEEAATAARAQGYAVQTPPSIQVDRLGPDAETRHLLAQSGIRLPCIVKPRVACGTPEAHQMAVVLHEDGFQDLQVAMPGCLQQFINHNGVLHKVYVMGNQMHVAERQSIPNLPASSTKAASAGLPHAIAFDSLKSLPHRDYLQPHYESQQNPPGFGLKTEVVRVITEELRKRLGLRLFGYDTVVQEDTGVHFIIDVNYFPSYKEFPEVAKALSDVLKKAYHAHRSLQQTRVSHEPERVA